ncbi:MAG: DNA polymerase III subunit delta [Rickettsiales bacterium]|nr:MAG: DNA polymerase III subunit delta [Rickettsiales bacterium]
MKIFSNNLPNLIQLIEKNQVKVLLLYGPNQGFISAVIKHITLKMNFSISNHNYKNLSANQLSLLANSQNFFNQKELIKITNVTTGISKELKEFFTENNFHNFICLVAEDSLPSSGIRNFFETHPNLCSMACYFDNEQTIGKMIVQQCNKESKIIDEDALFYLKSHLSGDHQLIKSELDKILYYSFDKETISKQDVLDCLSNSLIASGDEMCIYFAKKQYNLFLQEIEKLQNQNINEILMIRALIRYFLNIYNVAMRVEDGESLDQAVKSITPPIFYKYLNDFKQISLLYNSSDAIKIISHLQQNEINFKQNSGNFNLFETLMNSKNK